MVEIDRISFMLAFEEGASFDYAEPQTFHLDRQTGEVLWVYENDEDAESVAGIPPEENRALRERVEADPGRYLDIPRLESWDYNEILRDFLDSDWTDDDGRRQRATDAYSGRIGQWKRRVGDRDTIHAFNAYRDPARRRARRGVPARARHRAALEVGGRLGRAARDRRFRRRRAQALPSQNTTRFLTHSTIA